MMGESTTDEFVSPMWGRCTGLYLTSEDGTERIAVQEAPAGHWKKIGADLKSYKWSDGDFLLMAHPKNGTHYVWEVMTMLLRNSSEYIKEPKEVCMMDLFPLSETEKVYPRGTTKVLNTHYMLHVLPNEFHNQKTVLVIRNPKDAAVSRYYHMKQVAKHWKDVKARERFMNFTFSDYLRQCWFVEDQGFGSYLYYHEKMWTAAKSHPSMLVVFFEDIKKTPVDVIRRINEFMKTGCTEELIHKIADVTAFSKMKLAKSDSDAKARLLVKTMSHKPLTDEPDSQQQVDNSTSTDESCMYRKGEIGDWKNHFTVADNEMLEEALQKWPTVKTIPFQYE